MPDMYELYNDCSTKLIEIEEYLEAYYNKGPADEGSILYFAAQRAFIKEMVKDLNLNVDLKPL